jgi:hypothetical protein
MNLPGYDEWKLMSPDDERDVRGGDVECPFCGAWTGQDCLLDDQNSDGMPPCIGVLAYRQAVRDPDTWREEREEAKRDRENDR